MRALALAFAGSMALHVAAFAMLPRSRPESRPLAAVQFATVDIEIATSGGAGALSAVERRPRLRLRARPQVAPASLPAEPRRSTPTTAPTAAPTPTPTPTPTPNTIATLGQHRGWPLPTATAESGGAPMLDLAAFFDRLQRAAKRCAGPRVGEGRVRFCVDADGAPIDISLVQSTGNFALDDAALRCVIPGAAPFPRTDRCLVVPLAFH